MYNCEFNPSIFNADYEEPEHLTQLVETYQHEILKEPGNFRAVVTVDNALSLTAPKGSIVIIKQCESFDGEGTFALAINGGTRIRHRKLSDRGYIFKGDDSFHSLSSTKDVMASIQVIGRVVGVFKNV
ncbi:hypothetical protein ACU5EH_21840 [Aliivibrio salmonicida]